MISAYDFYPNINKVLRDFFDYCYHTLQEFEEFAEQSGPTRYPKSSLENMISNVGISKYPKEFVTEEDADQNNIDHIDPETGFTVRYVLPNELPRGFDDFGNYWVALGLCNYNTREIKVDKTMSTPEKKWTRYHEVGHAKGDCSEIGADRYADRMCGYSCRQAT